MKRLTFYNHYGYGDLFESREFVRDWMRLAGAETADYAHRECPNFFEDLPGIRSVEMRPEFDMRAAVTHGPDEALWVNTWIGARNAATNPPGDYVIWPGVGCTVENLFRMHNDYLREAGLPPLPRPMVEYLPIIDYVKVRLAPALCDFIDALGTTHRALVLVCNGATGSGHASNFSMGEMVGLLAPRPGVGFALTERHAALEGREDVVFTDDLTDRRPPETDLNAISFLSRFCQVIVGRCSGAQMPTQVYENWMDPSKTQVCFTEHRNGACFVLEPEKLGLNMKVHWAAPLSPEEGAWELRKVLDRL